MDDPGATPSMNELQPLKRKFSMGAQLSILGVVVLVAGVFVAVIGTQQSTEQRSRAQYTTPYRANAPLAGETWKQGTTHTITWVPGTSNGTVFISLIDVPRWKVAYSVVSNTPDNGSYTWTIPTSVQSTEYMIYIECRSCTTQYRQYGYGDKFFIDGGYVAPTSIPTIVPTAYVTSAPTVTPTLAPTGVIPTATTVPTEVPDPSATSIALTLSLNGIGHNGNANPVHPQRTATIDVFDSQNQLIKTEEGLVTYQAGSGKFVGTFDLGVDITTGVYTVKVKVDQYLRNLIPGIQSITQGKDIVLPEVMLSSGDINGDNTIDIVDYNILMGCYSDLLPPSDCSGDNDILSDLTDDGKTNQFDYNFLLRELSTKSGQ